jgi:hypothetical protein
MLLLCPALHLLETEMTVSRPSNKKTRTLKNVEQKFFTKVVLAAVLRIQNLGFGDFLNPESGNRNPGNGMKKIGSGIFLTIVLG